MFDKVLIIGGGLIGSSIARAARAHVQAIAIADASQQARRTIMELGLAEHVSPDGADHVDADLVILCVPPAAMASAAAPVVPRMKPGAILSDVGSYKAGIIADVAPLVPEGVHFLPGHPIAGTEFSGPEAGLADLFEGRWCILTPLSEDTDTTALSAFWTAMGSKVTLMSPDRHDRVMATTSHVPHLIAYTLVGTAADMEAVMDDEVVKFSAGGFRDFTRIAASDPELWRDVFLGNRDSVLEVVDRFIEDLSALKRAIRWGEGETLTEHFSRNRDIRKKILDAGQDREGFKRRR